MPSPNASFHYRELLPFDQEFLWDMLYVALWDAPDEPRRPRSVLDDPRIRKLVADWGRTDDFGIVAVDPDSGLAVGAIWSRLDGFDELDGFGCDYPCLGIAVVETQQGKGVGGFLMGTFIALLRDRVPGLRLGVNPKNDRAIRLYEKFGFREYAIGHGGYPQMQLRFGQ